MAFQVWFFICFKHSVSCQRSWRSWKTTDSHALFHSPFIQTCPCVYNIGYLLSWFYVCSEDKRFQFISSLCLCCKFLMIYHVADWLLSTMTGFPLSYRAHVSLSVKWSTMTLFTIGTAKLYNFLSVALPRHFRSFGRNQTVSRTSRLRLKTPETSVNSHFMIYWQSPIHTSDPPIHPCLPHFRTGQFRLSVRVGIVQLGMHQRLKTPCK